MTRVGRRQRLTPAERREQLQSAAVEVLAGQGYRGATADAIAERAGVSKGLLWHYFADLDELFELTARRTLLALSSAAAAAIDLDAPASQVIRSAVHAAAQLQRTHRAERRAMNEIVLNLRNADGGLRLSHADLDGLYAAQEAIFRRGQRDGDVVAALDPRMLAVTYQGAVEAMLSYLDAYPDTDAERFADTVADVLLTGLSTTGLPARPARATGQLRSKSTAE